MFKKKILISLSSSSFLILILILYINIKINSIKRKDLSKTTLNPEFKTNLQIKLEPRTGLCEFKSKFILIYMFTSAKSFTKRQLSRDTWGNNSKSLNNLFNFQLVFILGNQLDETINNQLLLEQAKYNDLIQGNFIDSYRNLSYKSLIAWKWIHMRCNKTSYVIKLDDDILLNIFKLNELISTSNNNNNVFQSTNNNLFLCWTISTYPERNKKSKWFVSKLEYNNELYKNVANKKMKKPYPLYCAGPAVIMTADLISRLYLKAFDIKLFWIDDVYVGILGHYVNAKFKDISNLFSKDLKRLEDILFIFGADSLEDTQRLWNTLYSKYKYKIFKI
jgi:hypothetical protein